jgi:hypothetical protein
MNACRKPFSFYVKVTNSLDPLDYVLDQFSTFISCGSINLQATEIGFPDCIR